MVKVALCLSGQPRCYRETFPYIYKHIIEPNQADVFFHTWFDKSEPYMEKFHMNRGECHLRESTLDELVLLYKPKDYMAEKQREFKKPNLQVPQKRIQNVLSCNKELNWTEEQAKSHVVKQNTSMYYSIFKANELKENYASQNNIVYDYVIRCRFDCIPLAPILCETFDPNTLHFQDMGHPDGLVSDWINFGSNLVMNIYGSIYLHLDYLNSIEYYPLSQRLSYNLEPTTTCGGFGEHALRDMMTLHKIPVRGVQMHAILHPNT